MEHDVSFEGFVVPVSPGLDPYGLDAGVEAFSIGIGLSQREDVQDPLHPFGDQSCHFLHGFQS
jgi:hypothetical protein